MFRTRTNCPTSSHVTIGSLAASSDLAGIHTSVGRISERNWYLKDEDNEQIY